MWLACFWPFHDLDRQDWFRHLSGRGADRSVDSRRDPHLSQTYSTASIWMLRTMARSYAGIGSGGGTGR